MMRGKGLLKVLALGLMLACAPAYAADSSAPAATTQNQAQSQADQADAVPTSPEVGDAITDWSIGFLAVIALLFFTASFWEKRKKNRK